MIDDQNRPETQADAAARRLLSSPTARLLLAVVPAEQRQAFEGDLCERLQRDVLGRAGASQAWLWLHAELVRSLPALLRARATGNGARARWLAALVTALFGALQAWDAGAFRSSSMLVLALIAVAIATPPMAIALSASRQGMLVAIGVTTTLAFTARLIEPLPLNGLGLIVVPAVAYFLLIAVRQRPGRRVAG